MSSSTGEGNGAGANLGSPIAPKFQVQPRLRLFQAESQGVLGLIEWLFEFGIRVAFSHFMLFMVCVCLPIALAVGISNAQNLNAPQPVRILLVLAFGAAGVWLFGKVSLAGTILEYFLRLRSRAEVELCERGVRATYASGRVVELPFADQAGVEMTRYIIAPAGRTWGESCKVILYRDDRAALRPVLKLWGDWPGKLAPDHPAILLGDRSLAAAKERALAQISTGRPLRGRGWELTPLSLSARGTTIAVAQITDAEVQNGRLCIWAQDSARPALRLKWESPNAPVLLSILRDRLSRTAAPGEASGLGRIVIEKWWLGFNGALGAAVSALFGVFAWTLISESKIEEPVRTALGALILVAFLTLIYRLAARRFRIHARGLAQKGLLWTAELTDDEITGLSYSAVRYYTNGAYKGLLFAIRADPDRSTGKRAVEFRALLRSVEEEELDEFRDRVALRLASKMIAIVRRGALCDWCPQLVVGAEGVRCHPGSAFGRGPEIFVPYTDIAAFRLELGHCNVILRSTGGPATSVEQSQYNFWPAYFAARTLAAECSAPQVTRS